MTSRPPVLLFGLLLFLVAADQFCILPLLWIIGRDLDFTRVQLCLLVTAYHAAAGTFGLFIGPMIDRRRHGRIFVWGLVLFVAASLLTIIVESFAVFVAIRVAAGLGASAIGVGVTSFISTMVARPQRRIVNGRVMIGVALGLVLGPLICGAIAEWSDWRWIYAFFGAAALPALPLVASLVRALPLPAYRRRLVLARGYLSLIRRLETGSGILVMFLFTGAIGGIMAILGLWLMSGVFQDVDFFDVAKVFTAGGLGVFAGGQLGGRLGQTFGYKRVVVGSSLLLLGCFSVLFFIDEWAGAVYSTFFCTALVESIRRGPLQGSLVGMVKTREMPAFTILKNGAGQAGMAVMAPIMGLLLDTEGTIRLPCVLAVVLTLSATVAYFFFIRPPARDLDAPGG